MYFDEKTNQVYPTAVCIRGPIDSTELPIVGGDADVKSGRSIPRAGRRSNLYPRTESPVQSSQTVAEAMASTAFLQITMRFSGIRTL
jgi:hypothetical protein